MRLRGRATMGVDVQPGALAVSFRTQSRIFLTFGALSACLSVVFSAAFAHLPTFAGGLPAMVQTALSQQQFHALGLLLVGLAVGWRESNRWWLASGWLMVVGVLLFSFNIYARAVLGFDTLRALVPWGGGAWILAWLLLALGALRSRGGQAAGL